MSFPMARPALFSITMREIPRSRASRLSLVAHSLHPLYFFTAQAQNSSLMHFGKGSYTVIQVLLKPHALKGLFGLNALILQDEAVELKEFSTEDLDDQLLHARSDEEQIVLLTTFLLAQWARYKTRDRLIEESLRLIHHTAGTVTVKSLRDYLEISERQFERRFGQTVGLSPLSYIRVRRFNEAIRLMKTGQFETLTEIAHALKFHDQSHFIREVKAFTGMTPKSLLQKADDFFHNQAGYSY